MICKSLDRMIGVEGKPCASQRRIQELLTSGNGHIEAARDARRAQAEAEFGEAHWRRVAVTMMATMRRLDPVWNGED